MVLEVSEVDGKYVVHLGFHTLEALISSYKEGMSINEVLKSSYINLANPHRRSIGNKVRPVIPGIQPTEDGDIKDKSYVVLEDSWKEERRGWPGGG